MKTYIWSARWSPIGIHPDRGHIHACGSDARQRRACGKEGGPCRKEKGRAMRAALDFLLGALVGVAMLLAYGLVDLAQRIQ